MNLPPATVEIPFYLFCTYAYHLPTTPALWDVGLGLYDFFFFPLFPFRSHAVFSHSFTLSFLVF